MQGFLLDNGDVAIEKGEIQMISGADLLGQTVETVLTTNKGEWWLNPDEGITFSNILGKHKKQESEKTSSNKQSATYVDNAETDEINALLAKRLDGVI